MNFEHSTGRISVSDTVDLYVKLGTPQVSEPNLPVIIFIHGRDMDHSVWKSQEKFFLSHDYRTVSYDLRGFGLSSRPEDSLSPTVHAEDLHKLISKLRLKEVILVGWSIGGMVAQAYALKHPQKVNYLVLVGTTPSIENTENFPYGRTLFDEKLLNLLAEGDFHQYTTKSAEATLPINFDSSSAHKLRSYLSSLIRQTGKDTTLRQARDAAKFNSVKELQNLKVPTLIVFGSDDRVINPGASLFMRAHIPNSHVLEFPSAGHAPFLTCKGKFNQAILRLISGESLQCNDLCESLANYAPQ